SRWFSLYSSRLSPRSPRLPRSFSVTPPAPSEIYTLSLHDALPILEVPVRGAFSHFGQAHRRPGKPLRTGSSGRCLRPGGRKRVRSEEHTSELQPRFELVCRLLLEKKKQDRDRRRAR